jgi:hypothetical protein
MAFKVKDLMTKIVPGTSPGPRIWACPDDSRDQCPDDSVPPHCQGHSHGPCPDDSRDQCRENTRGCPDDTNTPPNCPDDTNTRFPCMGHTRHPHEAAGRGSESLALLQRQLRERLDGISEARI